MSEVSDKARTTDNDTSPALLGGKEPATKSRPSKKKQKAGKDAQNQAGSKGVLHKPLIETRTEMYERLKHGAEYNHDMVLGVLHVWFP